MPVYTYRREDGTTFDYRQKFLDDPLIIDPETGQHVVRVIQPAGVIFKGSGFYVNDSKSASRSTVNTTAKSEKTETETKTTETKSDSAATSTGTSSTTTVAAGAAAD
jgi:predicted nucleic acid-binding Zn ribbon protein